MGYGDLPTMKDYVTGIKQMVDVVGVDHVGIGTDTSLARAGGGAPSGTNNIWPDERMDFVFRRTGDADARIRADEISKIAGGNYVRFFERSLAAPGFYYGSYNYTEAAVDELI
jgi:membrane dipeptidase